MTPPATGHTGSLFSNKLHVIQGEHAVSDDPAALMTTVLGSCVAACLHDPVAGVGGMNHFLLAETSDGARFRDEEMRYGAFAMEVLINGLMKLGARRERLEAKLFGGAKLFDSLNDVGAANAAFARRFLEDEGIPIVAASLGGRRARRVEFWPGTGRARQREVDQAPETPVVKRAPAPAASGGVELF
ncbi:MAG TPA: chemotaxis protein CheD [Caulobacteraceae bacterium]|nr:chemotaxis protein CheD [Caulobacteraceae bacterium]